MAVLHSHLSDAERHWQWQRIADGQVQVVVGARSAIFAPTPHLGLIVLDEEHETTFKQEIAPRYHARDVAIARAKAEGRAAGARLGDAVAGELAPGADGRVSDWSRCRGACSTGRLPGVGTIDLRERDARAGARAGRSAGSCTRRCARRWTTAAR